MPPIDVNLHTSGDGLNWSTLLVALASFVAVLVASLVTARSTLKAADRSASALLNVEKTRNETEHRRYLRALVADVVSTAAAYVRVVHMQTLRDGDEPESTLDKVGPAHEEFERAVALAYLTSADARIVEALDRVDVADSRLSRAVAEDSAREENGPSIAVLSALYNADGLQESCDSLVAIARNVLAEQ